MGEAGGVERVRTITGLECLLSGIASVYPSLESTSVSTWSCGCCLFPAMFVVGDSKIAESSLEAGEVNRGNNAILFSNDPLLNDGPNLTGTTVCLQCG